MASEPAHGPGGDVATVAGRDGCDPEGTGEAIIGILGDGIGKALAPGLVVAVDDAVGAADEVGAAVVVAEGEFEGEGVKVAENAAGVIAAEESATRASASENRRCESRGLMLFSLTK